MNRKVWLSGPFMVGGDVEKYRHEIDKEENPFPLLLLCEYTMISFDRFENAKFSQLDYYDAQELVNRKTF